ncbi:MAG: sigma-54-dependent Fis family transcriptional regulator, partial [Acidobacteriia bacterium]|nr:sigma-54-dependent Fis family transcriptional regulator [Terriglobia bacterium]
RVLDGAPYYRIGGQKKVTVDVRVVAATNQDLEHQIARGHFRSDLYHRLNQFRIRIPPLRERADDIVPLAEYFLKQHSARAVLCPDAQQALKRYPWPGNIRELRNAIAHASIASQSHEIRASDLPIAEALPSAAFQTRDALALDGVERHTILEALGRTGGHHQKAADLLGISRRTLSRKLKTYRMQEQAEEVSVYSN